MKLRIEFAHGSLRPVDRRQDGVPSSIEAFARTRITAVDAEGQSLGWYAWPEVRVLGDAVGAWRWSALPDLLLGLRSASGAPLRRILGAARTAETGPELEAHVPAEVQETLRRQAPRSWQILLQGTRLLQRGEAYRLAIQRGDLFLEHRPAGAGTPQRLTSDLLTLAHSLGAPERFSAPERVLLTELVRARWLHRRLPPGLRWDGSRRTFALRVEPSLQVREHLDSRGVPIALELVAATGGTPLELPCRPGAGLPVGVLRAGLEWLFAAPRESEELYLDPRGVLPREPFDPA